MNGLPSLIAVRDLDWSDLAAVHDASSQLLADLTGDPYLLGRLAARVPHDTQLVELCERYDVLDKLVLHDDPAGFRIRLHVFAPGYFDRPHSHRWPYTARILAGSYRHVLYQPPTSLDETVAVHALRPRQVRVEHPGATYTLHPDEIHAVTARPGTVSLIVRGPAVADRFLVTDRTTGSAWWQYGAAEETPAERDAKRMTAAQATDVVTRLASRGILPTTAPAGQR